MNKKMLLVSSDETFYGALSHISSQLEKYFFDTIIGDPSEELLQKIRQIIDENDLQGVVTRGSWTVFLKNELSVPVFPVKIDASDVYSNIHLLSAKGYRRIGIAIYSYVSEHNLPYGAIDCYRFGDLQLCISHFNNLNEIEYVIDRMASIYKIEYIFGDVEAVQVASRKQIPCNVIQLESRFLVDSIEQAYYIVQLNAIERDHRNRIHQITNLISEAVLSFDDSSNLITCNSSAAAMLKLAPDSGGTVEEILGLTLDDLLAQQPNKLVEIRGKSYIMNAVTSYLRDQATHTVILNSTHYIQKIEMSIRTQSKSNGMKAKHHFTDMIAIDKKSLQLVNVAKKYARSQGTILIRGETGTGKEVLASSIHNESPRRDGPFVALNCATLSENLIESELFGYEKGAFTGANSAGKKGLFELAHRGTIFLDEIGELPLNLQAKLLRVLQEREVMHLGGDKVIPIDVRVIAATNRDLHKMMREGAFREDLFYRLALLELNLLPLRERAADIVPLFITFLNENMRKNDLHFYWENTAVFNPLLSYSWPGNIRELENLAERVVLLSDQLRIDQELIRSLMREKEPAIQAETLQIPITNDLRMLEHQYVHFLLQKFNGDKNALCQYLNISRPTLWRKLSYGSPNAVEPDDA